MTFGDLLIWQSSTVNIPQNFRDLTNILSLLVKKLTTHTLRKRDTDYTDFQKIPVELTNFNYLEPFNEN